jgi:TPR repeat protein
MHAYGRGVPQNYTEALKRYRLLADQGNARVQYFLGFMYASDWGCRSLAPGAVADQNNREGKEAKLKWLLPNCPEGTDSEGRINSRACRRARRAGACRRISASLRACTRALRRAPGSGQLSKYCATSRVPLWG